MNRFQIMSAEPRALGGDSVMCGADASNFPCLDGLSMQLLRLSPGGERAAHTHPNAAQMDFVVKGTVEIGIVGPSVDKQIFTAEEGVVTFIPQGYLHWIANRTNEPAEIVLILNNAKPETLEFSDMHDAV